jgi:LDH2 family malate/lactate/ureidoglycolate dehydrogenase
MPVGWMIDRLGQPLTDPKRAEEGFLMPIGGYKGYGLSLIVGLLAGTLNGAAMGKDVIDFNHDDRTTTNTGQAVMAIDVSAFGDAGDFKARVDRLVRDLRASERMPGVERIWLPGEQSQERRAANERDGIPVPSALLEQLDAFAREMGIPALRTTEPTPKETTP